MSENILIRTAGSSERLQRRTRELGRAAVEGGRELPELLGEALHELRSTLLRVREMEAALRDRDATISELRAARGECRPDASRSGGAWHGRWDGGSGPPPDLLQGPAPARPPALEAALRARIAGALHLGTLAAGDSLPSIRELARSTGLNHKTVRRVYRALEGCGFVEVRNRSGIYVAPVESPVAGELEGVESWLAGVLVEAVQQGLRIEGLLPLLERSAGARRLRCACVESAEDDRFALRHEIEQHFGLHAVAVGIASAEPTESLAGADVVVTTPYHADEVRAALAPGQPLVVACLHPGVRQAMQAGLGDGSSCIVCVDPASGERLREGLAPEAARRTRVVAVDSLAEAGIERLPVSGVATLAAWQRLGGEDPPPGLSVPPYLSPRTIRHLAELVVHLNRTASG